MLLTTIKTVWELQYCLVVFEGTFLWMEVNFWIGVSVKVLFLISELEKLEKTYYLMTKLFLWRRDGFWATMYKSTWNDGGHGMATWPSRCFWSCSTDDERCLETPVPPGRSENSLLGGTCLKQLRGKRTRALLLADTTEGAIPSTV